MHKTHRVHEFAALTGVTVRALHHYDRLGLLRPRRTASGYRLYGQRELERLEQIVALKFIGIPLQQIKAILGRDPSNLPDALRAQDCIEFVKRIIVYRENKVGQPPDVFARHTEQVPSVLKEPVSVKPPPKSTLISKVSARPMPGAKRMSDIRPGKANRLRNEYEGVFIWFLCPRIGRCAECG